MMPRIAAGVNESHGPRKGIKFATPANNTSNGVYGNPMIV